MTKYIEKYPSKEFSDHIGIDFLYKDWVVYPLLTCKSLIRYGDKRIDKLFNKLLLDNPDLNCINITNSHDKFNVLMGCISKFSLDDIKYFTENYSNIVEYNINTTNEISKIEVLTNTSCQWVLSPITISKLNKILNIK